MTKRVRCLPLFLAAGVFAWPAAAADARLPVLIVDGINNHDWQTGTGAIQAILDATGRFRVDISTTPPRGAPPEAWHSWHPDFSRYNAVIVNFNGGHLKDGIRWPRETEQAFEKYVRDGGGAVIFHAANNAFLTWPAYNEMIGLGWRDKAFGPGLIVGDDGTIVKIPAGSGLNPGHGPRHDFQMRILDRTHPITRGIPDRWLHPSEQLTHGQHGPADGLTILTYAHSKDSNQNEPMDWVRTYGKGRVYTTMLGHTWKNETNPNLEDVGFQTLLARGVEWAASGHVTVPIPIEFPRPDKVLLKRIEPPAASSLLEELQKQWPANRTVNIVCHGHSVPAGYFKTPVVSTFDAYPHLLLRSLKERFPYAVINVIVTAIGGEDSIAGAERFERDVLSLNPDVVLIDYALNDRRATLQQTEDAWTRMIVAAQRRNVRVILLTPTADTSARLDDPADPLNQRAVQVRALAAKYHTGLADSAKAFAAHAAAHGGVEDLMSQVNHPNRKGHELVVREILKALLPPTPAS